MNATRQPLPKGQAADRRARLSRVVREAAAAGRQIPKGVGLIQPRELTAREIAHGKAMEGRALGNGRTRAT